jgi:hypothetical protein
MYYTLLNLGLIQSAHTLKQESALEINDSQVNTFNNLFMNGEWEKVYTLIENNSIPDQNKLEVKFKLIELTFIEQLLKKDLKQALNILQNQFP